MDIFEAVSADNIDFVKKYLANGGEVNIYADMEKFPVPLMAYVISVKMLILFLSHDADVDYKQPQGDCAIHFFTVSNRADMVHTLLVNQADLDMKTYELGETPLHIAARKGYDNLVGLFISYGAKRKVGNKDGKTPLETSIDHKHQKCIELMRQPKKRKSESFDVATIEMEKKKRLSDTAIDKFQAKKLKIDSQIQELKRERIELVLSGQAEELENCKQHLEATKDKILRNRRKLVKLKTKVKSLEEVIEEEEKSLMEETDKVITNEKNFFIIQKLKNSGSKETCEDMSYHCPICMQIPLPPAHIFQCSSGHVYCSSCKLKPNMTICPQCRKSIKGLNIRNRVLEDLIQKTFVETKVETNV